ncbi:MAG: inorganic diphosphatase, partial [Bacteroidota bacterium]
MNLLHDIPAGSADEMNVIIEIPKFSKNKYEIDKDTGMIALDRVMHTAQDYPFDYGFVPQTLFDDGDALDVVLLTTYPLAPGILVKARPVAIMEMIDGGERDDKVVAVPVDDPRFADIADLGDVNKHFVKEMTHFFETYKKVQQKEVEVGEWYGADKAKEAFAKEIKKVRRINPQVAEYSVMLNYLELMLDLPWDEYTKDNFNLKKVKSVLDKDHTGLEKVKERILEHLAVLKLKADKKAPIICFYGPPGVGKTSLGKSIARAMNKEFIRISLGGARDEAEIRGHRRTYIGAMP